MLGSTRVLTAQDQGVKGRYDYEPFGRELSLGRNVTGGTVRQKFTGYERNTESDLDYAQARYYSSAQGRFTTPDPVFAGSKLTRPQNFNRYAYCVNNPLKLVDPTGLDWGIVGNMPTYYPSVEARLKAGVPAFRPQDNVYLSTDNRWWRLNDDGTQTEVTDTMTRLKNALIDVATGGFYHDVIRAKDEVTTAWHVTSQAFSEYRFELSLAFSELSEHQPGRSPRGIWSSAATTREHTVTLSAERLPRGRHSPCWGCIR